VALAASEANSEGGSYSSVETTATKSSALPSLAWVRSNAENILFLEHLRRQAAEGDLYGWRSQLGSEEYQSRLDDLLSMGTSSECGSSSCGTSDCATSECSSSSCSSSSCEDSSMLIDRISVLEGRCGESSCGGEMSCGGGGGCEMYGQRMLILQAELRRQRLMIQRLYQQVTIISQSSSCRGKRYFFKLNNYNPR